MRILIVDDEYFTRKALIRTILKWSPDVTVCEAGDGHEALEQLGMGPVNIVFSDIRMPRVDGMQLAAEIRSQYPDVFNVIISGYDDFQYTQKAIMHKVEHYLLKPVKKHEIHAILEKVRVDLALNEDKTQEDLLAALICDGADPRRLPLHYEPGSIFVAAVLEGDHIQLVETLTRQAFREHPMSLRLIRDKKYSNICIAVWHGDEDAAGQLHDLRGVFGSITSEYKKQTDGLISVGIGESHAGVGQLARSYQEAKSAFLYRLLSGIGVYMHHEVKNYKQYTLPMLDETLLPLYNTMMNNKAGEAKDLVHQLFCGIADMKQLSVYALPDICSKLTATLNSAIEFVNNRNEASEAYIEPPDLYTIRSMKDLSHLFISHISAVAAKLELCHTREDMIQKIMDYVDRNYAQNILLEDLAKNVYYTDSSYLSKLFKKKSGISFTQYVISVRLEKARKLLESDSGMTVSQVASHIGFNDYSHFIQMYKKHFGETPGVFKKK